MKHAVKHGRLVLAVVVSAVIAAVVMPIALSQGAQIAHVKLSKAQQRKRQHMRGKRGARGPRGFRGATGRQGPAGATGPAGAGSVQVHNVTLNWQNNAWPTNNTVGFPIPGIGLGQIVCSPDTQWLRVFPFNAQDEVTMWLVRQQDGLPATVRTARHATGTGADFNEGFNRYPGQQSTTGSFFGLISDRGTPSSHGPGPAATSFQLSFNWTFNDGDPRCYIAAKFTTGV